MSEEMKKRIKSLVLFLIKRRLDIQKTDGYEADIKFNPNEVNSDLFDHDERKRLDQIKSCLHEIGHCELQEQGEYPCKVIENIKYEEDGTITLTRTRTENLFRYMHKRLTKSESLFGTSSNAQHQTILTFMDIKTPVTISGKPSWIFSYLKKHPNTDVSYIRLYNDLKRSMPVGPEYWERLYDNDESKKMKFINDGIDQLRKKLNEASKNIFKEMKVDIIINKRYRGAGDEPGIYKLIF